MNTLPPRLTFFCELEPEPLEALFSGSQVIDFLVEMRAAVSLGLVDFSDQRAEIVRRLNTAGVPVHAWLLLPKKQGYWFNLNNAQQAVTRYNQFLEWTNQHALYWARIGLDIEPDIQSLQGISKKRLTALPALITPMFNANRLTDGLKIYRGLVEQIHADGHQIEAYHFPFLIDERIARSNALQKLTGLVDLPGIDHEAFMLYSSFSRPWGPGLLWSYGPLSEIIAVGSTGGGVEFEGSLNVRPLNWTELQSDLLLANQLTPYIYIFSLEGCVQQNFLPLLRRFDWQQPAQVPYRTAQQIEDLRKVFQRALWMLTQPAWILFGLALLISGLTLLSRRTRK